MASGLADLQSEEIKVEIIGTELSEEYLLNSYYLQEQEETTTRSSVGGVQTEEITDDRVNSNYSENQQENQGKETGQSNPVGSDFKNEEATSSGGLLDVTCESSEIFDGDLLVEIKPDINEIEMTEIFTPSFEGSTKPSDEIAYSQNVAVEGRTVSKRGRAKKNHDGHSSSTSKSKSKARDSVNDDTWEIVEPVTDSSTGVRRSGRKRRQKKISYLDLLEDNDEDSPSCKSEKIDDEDWNCEEVEYQEERAEGSKSARVPPTSDSPISTPAFKNKKSKPIKKVIVKDDKQSRGVEKEYDSTKAKNNSGNFEEQAEGSKSARVPPTSDPPISTPAFKNKKSKPIRKVIVRDDKQSCGVEKEYDDSTKAKNNSGNMKKERIYTNCDFQCQRCEKVFRYKKSLENHLLSCRGIQSVDAPLVPLRESKVKLVCPVCQLKFRAIGTAKKHLAIRHVNLMHISCTVCSKKISNNMGDMVGHFQKQHKLHCSKRKDDLAPGSNSIQCPVCPRQLHRRRLSLKAHLVNHHSKLFHATCILCRRPVGTMLEYFDHFTSFHSHASFARERNKAVVTTDTEKMMKKTQTLKANNKDGCDSLSSEKTDLVCEQCNKSLPSYKLLALHVLSHKIDENTNIVSQKSKNQTLSVSIPDSNLGQNPSPMAAELNETINPSSIVAPAEIVPSTVDHETDASNSNLNLKIGSSLTTVNSVTDSSLTVNSVTDSSLTVNSVTDSSLNVNSVTDSFLTVNPEVVPPASTAMSETCPPVPTNGEMSPPTVNHETERSSSDYPFPVWQVPTGTLEAMYGSVSNSLGPDLVSSINRSINIITDMVKQLSSLLDWEEDDFLTCKGELMARLNKVLQFSYSISDIGKCVLLVLEESWQFKGNPFVEVNFFDESRETYTVDDDLESVNDENENEMETTTMPDELGNGNNPSSVVDDNEMQTRNSEPGDSDVNSYLDGNSSNSCDKSNEKAAVTVKGTTANSCDLYMSVTEREPVVEPEMSTPDGPGCGDDFDSQLQSQSGEENGQKGSDNDPKNGIEGAREVSTNAGKRHNLRRKPKVGTSSSSEQTKTKPKVGTSSSSSSEQTKTKPKVGTSSSSAEHTKTKKGKKKHVCKKCGKHLSKKSSLVCHMAVHATVSLFKCKVCSAAFKSEQRLKRHLKVHLKDDQHKCDFCDFTARTICIVQKHSYEEHPNSPLFSCDLCLHKAKTSFDLTIHKRIHQPKKCKMCEFEASHASELSKHERKEHADKSCPHCSFRCFTSFQLNRHLKTHMNGEPDNIFCCEICGATFNTTCKLQYHVLRHTNNTPLSCPQCDYKCSSRQSYQSHMLKHSGLRPYKCKVCDASFARSSYLKVHNRQHSDETEFCCRYCGKGFKYKYNCQEHEMIHTGEKKFKCRYCHFACRRRKILEQHMAEHKGRGDTLSGDEQAPSEEVDISSLVLKPENLIPIL